MPSDAEMLEHVLVRTKDRKSSKKCREGKCDIPKYHDVQKHHDVPKPCDVECCLPDCNPECCTPAFQRLDKLRNYWLLSQFGLNTSATAGPLTLAIPAFVYNRSGTSVTVPVHNTLTPYWNAQSGSQAADATNTWNTNERQAFAFVNTVRYLTYEECGKLDQVTGWSVDVQTGDLYFYQNLPELGLLITDSRLYYLTQQASAFTPQDKQKLTAMEPFWKLSLKAVERVRENPKTEGNICEVKDKCGNRFLIAVNRAAGQITQSGPYPSTGADVYAGNGVCEYNSQYSIVVVKLC